MNKLCKQSDWYNNLSNKLLNDLKGCINIVQSSFPGGNIIGTLNFKNYDEIK